MVVFSPKQGKQLVKDIKSAADASKGIDPAEAARIKKAKELEARNRKAAIGTTAVVLGAGSFVLARKAAKVRAGGAQANPRKCLEHVLKIIKAPGAAPTTDGD